MAVSMNAGFMRSDYMISDAAIPMRMEELEQLEQSAKFSEILGEIGDAPVKEVQPAQDTEVESNVVSEADTPVTEGVAVDSEGAAEKVVLTKAELKDLARKVVRGELKLSEIPEELKTDVLLMVIAMMLMGIPEDEIPALQDAPEGDITVAVGAIEPEKLKSDKTPELNELLLKFAKTQQETDKTEELSEIDSGVPAQPEDIMLKQVDAEYPEHLAEVAVPVQVQEIPEADVVQEVEKLSTEPTPISKEVEHISFDSVTETEQQEIIALAGMVTDDTIKAESTSQPVKTDANVQNAVAEPIASVQMPTGSAQAHTSNNSGFGKNDNPTTATNVQITVTERGNDISEEFVDIRRIVSEVTVKTTEPQKQTDVQNTVEVSFRSNDMQRSRLVVKSDELSMLKNAAAPVADETADELNVLTQNVPQTEISEMPMVFTRSDGSEVSVKPAEVLEQVTTGIIEHAETATDGKTEYSITLTPEDLGSITVKLTKAADGALTVSIAADNARTQRLLEESGLAIQNSLRQNGIELESWQTVNESQQETRAQDYQGSSKNPYYQEENDSENSDADDNSFAELISAM